MPHLKDYEKINLMVAEDSEFFIANVRNILEHFEENFEIKFVLNIEQLKLLLDRVSPEILVVDLNFPDGNMLEVLPLIRSQNPETSIIVMSSQPDIKTAFLTLENGANNYVCKGESFVSDLLSAIRNSIFKIQLLRQLKKLRDTVFQESNFPFIVYEISEEGITETFRDFVDFPERIDESTEEFLVNIGISYMVLLGRGEKYNEGVFVFPATRSKFYDIMLISVTMNNPKAKDHRLKVGYFQFCLFIPKMFMNLFPSLTVMQEYIKMTKEYFVDSNNFNKEKLLVFKDHLIDQLKQDSH